jgi:methyl-accepting chemotaxis protein
MSGQAKGSTPRYGLRFKVTAMMTALFITLSLILSWFSITRTMTSLEEELKRRGAYLAKTLAYNGQRGVAAGDNKALTVLVRYSESPSSSHRDVTYAIVLDAQGKVLAHTDSSLVGKSDVDEETRKGMGVKDTTIFPYRDREGEELYDVVSPVFLKTDAEGVSENENKPTGDKIGFVRVGLSLKNIEAQRQSNLFLSLLLTSAVVAIGIAISFFFVRYIVKPIEQMAVISTQIAEGDFTQTIQVLSRAQFDDEIGVLAKTFSAMSSNLNEMIRKIRSAANNVAAAADQISNISQRASGGANVQAEAIDKTSSSMEEMNASMKEIAEGVGVLSSAAEASASSILQMTASISEEANNTVNLSSSVEDTSSSIIEMSASIKQVAQNSEVLSSAAEETALAANEINASIKEVENRSNDAAVVSES